MEVAEIAAATPAKSEGKKESRLIWMTVLLAAIVVARAFSGVFFYVFAAVSLILFTFCKVSYCISLLFFLLPVASILKTGVGSISFFTVLFFLTVIKLMISEKRLSPNFLLMLMSLGVYLLAFSGIGQITTILTMLAGLIMLYCVRSTKVSADTCVISYSLGICFASVLAECRSFLPIIQTFVQDSAMKLAENSYATRFSGLQGNPNYFTLDIIVALSALVVLIYNKKPTWLHMGCFILLSAFGLMSISKSFLLSWIILMLFWFLVSLKQGVSRFVKMIFILILTITTIYFVAYDSVELYLQRFLWDSSGTVNSITTGRSDIWKAYITEILGDLKILFFGNGLNTISSYGKGAHNTYLESIYTVGVLGSMLLFITVKVAMRRVLIQKIILIPITVLLIRMFGIGIMTYDNLWFYLLIIVILSMDQIQQTAPEIVRMNG